MNNTAEAVKDLPASARRGVRPCFVDGRCSAKTYLTVAAKTVTPEDEKFVGPKVHNLIGIRNLGGDRYRWHAYPSWEFFNMEKPVMGHTSHNSHCGYDTTILTGEHTKALIEQLNHQRGITAATVEQAMAVLKRGYDSQNDATDKSHRDVHA